MENTETITSETAAPPEEQTTLDQIAVAVRDGHRELESELWTRCRRYISKAAYAYAVRHKAEGRLDGAIDSDDLISSAYFGMTAAVSHYDPTQGHFLNLLSWYLRNAFEECNGGRNRKKLDFMTAAVSLETPIPGEDLTIADMLGADDEGLEAVENDLEQEELHKALEAFLDKSCRPTDAKIIRKRYFDGCTQTAIAHELRQAPQTVAMHEARALDRMHRQVLTDAGRELRAIAEADCIMWRHMGRTAANHGKREVEENALLLLEKYR